MADHPTRGDVGGDYDHLDDLPDEKQLQETAGSSLGEYESAASSRGDVSKRPKATNRVEGSTATAEQCQDERNITILGASPPLQHSGGRVAAEGARHDEYGFTAIPRPLPLQGDPPTHTFRDPTASHIGQHRGEGQRHAPTSRGGSVGSLDPVYDSFHQEGKLEQRKQRQGDTVISGLKRNLLAQQTGFSVDPASTSMPQVGNSPLSNQAGTSQGVHQTATATAAGFGLRARRPATAAVPHVYRDFAGPDAAQLTLPTKRKGRRGIQAFPQKLHQLLDDADARGFTDIICWQHHGRAFCIHSKKRLVKEIMPNYFRQTKFASFHRQLDIYGFTCIRREGMDHGAYFHELFLRGKKELCTRIPRVLPGESSPWIPHDYEPDFSKFPPLPGPQPQPGAATTQPTAGLQAAAAGTEAGGAAGAARATARGHAGAPAGAAAEVATGAAAAAAGAGAGAVSGVAKADDSYSDESDSALPATASMTGSTTGARKAPLKNDCGAGGPGMGPREDKGEKGVAVTTHTREALQGSVESSGDTTEVSRGHHRGEVSGAGDNSAMAILPDSQDDLLFFTSSTTGAETGGWSLLFHGNDHFEPESGENIPSGADILREMDWD